MTNRGCVSCLEEMQALQTLASTMQSSSVESYPLPPLVPFRSAVLPPTERRFLSKSVQRQSLLSQAIVSRFSGTCLPL